MTKSLTLNDVITRAQVARSLMLDLLRAGAIVPGVQDSPGRGVPRQFAEDDVIRVRVAAHLRGFGIPTKVIKKLLEHIDDERRRGAHVVRIEANRNQWAVTGLSRAEAKLEFPRTSAALWIRLDELTARFAV